MSRMINRLSSAKVAREIRPGLYGDGAGLYLNVGPTGGKSWLFRYMLKGRAREMGLGPIHTIGLAEARERAAAARRLLLDGVDPLDAKEADKARRAAVAASVVTFRRAAEAYIRAHRAGWRNEKHAGQWTTTLATFVYPEIGDVAVGAVDTGHVTKLLSPIWTTVPPTAARIRGRIESILDYARTHGWRTGENPARWKGHLQNVLPARGKVAKVKHHPALPWREIGQFMAELDKEAGTAVLALRFTILTIARTSEVIGATWAEVDTRAKVWTVPPERMKADREHRVPLSAAALGVLGEVAKLRQSDAPDALLFPGNAARSKLHHAAMLSLLHRLGWADLTVHGFRSTFRDWAAETGQPDDIAEAALAHSRGDKTVAAYQRGDLLARRRTLMDQWAAFCLTPAPAKGVVVPLIAAR